MRQYVEKLKFGSTDLSVVCFSDTCGRAHLSRDPPQLIDQLFHSQRDERGQIVTHSLENQFRQKYNSCAVLLLPRDQRS